MLQHLNETSYSNTPLIVETNLSMLDLLASKLVKKVTSEAV